LTAPIFVDILNLSQVGDEKADHNILAIDQTALVPYCQELFPGKCEELIRQSCEILTATLRKHNARMLPFS
jgi:hypothetical protein